MQDIPLPEMRPERQIDGVALVRAFLESDDPQLPTDPDEMRAFADEIHRVVNAPPTAREMRRPAEVRQAHDSIRTKSARLRGGKVGDGGFGGIIDNVGEFVGSPFFDGASAVVRGIGDGSAVRTLGGLGLLASSLIPGGVALRRGMKAGEESLPALRNLESMVGRELQGSSHSASELFGQAHGALDAANAVRRAPTSLKSGTGLGALSGISAAAAQGETDPTALLAAGGLGSVVGGVSDRVAAKAGHAGQFGKDEYSTISGGEMNARLDVAADALEDRIPMMKEQIQRNLEAEQLLQTQAIDTDQSLAQHLQTRRLTRKAQSRLAQDGASDGPKSTTRPAALPQRSMLERLNAGDHGQFQAPQTYGQLPVSVSFSQTSNIGAKPAKTKAASTKKPRRNPDPGGAIVQGIRAKLKDAGLSTTRQRSANPQKARQILRAHAKEHGVTEGFLRKQLAAKRKN